MQDWRVQMLKQHVEWALYSRFWLLHAQQQEKKQSLPRFVRYTPTPAQYENGHRLSNFQKIAFLQVSPPDIHTILHQKIFLAKKKNGFCKKG